MVVLNGRVTGVTSGCSACRAAVIPLVAVPQYIYVIYVFMYIYVLVIQSLSFHPSSP